MVKEIITWLYVRYVLVPEVNKQVKEGKVFVVEPEVYRAMYDKEVITRNGIARTDH